MSSTTTIVSAFISNVNSRSDRDLQKYAEFGNLLIQSTTPKVIFLDEIMYNIISAAQYNKGNTTIIKISDGIRSSYLYNLLPQLTRFQLNTSNPTKDTLHYIITMCNKTEWVRQAINTNPYNSTNFVWVDFGLRHVFGHSDKDYINALNKLKNKKYDNIRIASIDPLYIPLQYDIYTTICWYFAGGVFGGNKDSLILFADVMKGQCKQIVETHGTLMWEVNIWYLIYKSMPWIFDPYECNHNNSILENY